TGPRSPDSNRGSSLPQYFQVVNATRSVGLGLFSTSHCGQRASGAPQLFGNGTVEAGAHSQSSGNCSSPIRRFGQRLTTWISKSLFPAASASVTSTAKDGFHRIPRFLPFNLISAITQTFPRWR